MSRPPTTPSPDSEMSDSPRPRYFLVRNDGTLTPLVAVDELPPTIRIRGVPAVVSFADTQGMISLGVVARSERRYILESSSYSSASRIGTPSSGQPAMIVRPNATEEHATVRNDGMAKNETSHIQHAYGTQPYYPNAAVWVPGQAGQQVETWRQGIPSDVDEIQVRPGSSLIGPRHLTQSQAAVDAIVDAASRDEIATASATNIPTATNPPTLPNPVSTHSLRQNTPSSSHAANTDSTILPPGSSTPAATTTTGNTRPPPTSNASTSPTPTPKKKEKVYCSFWIRRGECDYTQQGCLYKHEMPTDRATLRELGITMIPRWWREANAVKVGASGWNEKAGLGAGKEKERGMWRAGAGPNGAGGQASQGLGAQGSTIQTPNTLPPPQLKATEGMRMMAAAQLGGQQFTTPARAAPLTLTPTSSPVAFSSPRQMMRSRYSPPAATPMSMAPATSSSSAFSLPPAPAAAYRQQYTPFTPNGHISQTPAPSPVGLPQPPDYRLPPPSAAAEMPQSSSAEGTATPATPVPAQASSSVTPIQRIPISNTPTSAPHHPTVPGTSPPGPALLPAYQPLTPSSPHRQTASACAPSPVPQPKPVTAFDLYNSVPTPPQLHRRLFVSPGQSQFVTMATAEAEKKKAAKDEVGRLRGQTPKGNAGDVGQARQEQGQGQGQGKENGVLVEFGEG